MNENVYWMLELEIQPGRDKDIQALMKEMVGATKNEEPGTTIYEWSFSGDGRSCHILERFADSAVALKHLGTFGERFAARFAELFKTVRFVVYGSPSAEVKDALTAFNPVYMKPADGFNR